MLTLKSATLKFENFLSHQRYPGLSERSRPPPFEDERKPSPLPVGSLRYKKVPNPDSNNLECCQKDLEYCVYGPDILSNVPDRY